MSAKMTHDNRKTTISLAIENRYIDFMNEEVRKSGHSLSAYLRGVIVKHLDKKGFKDER